MNRQTTTPRALTEREVAELDRKGRVVWKYQPPDNMTPWKVRRR